MCCENLMSLDSLQFNENRLKRLVCFCFFLLHFMAYIGFGITELLSFQEFRWLGSMVSRATQHCPPDTGPLGEAGSGQPPHHTKRRPAPLQGRERQCDRDPRYQLNSGLPGLQLLNTSTSLPRRVRTHTL